MCERPSVRVPGYAANAAPRSTLRLSLTIRRGVTPRRASRSAGSKASVSVSVMSVALRFFADLAALGRQDHVVDRRVGRNAQQTQRLAGHRGKHGARDVAAVVDAAG